MTSVDRSQMRDDMRFGFRAIGFVLVIVSVFSLFFWSEAEKRLREAHERQHRVILTSQEDRDLDVLTVTRLCGHVTHHVATDVRISSVLKGERVLLYTGI